MSSDPAPPASGGDDLIIGRAFRWSLLIFGVAGAALGLMVLWLRQEPPAPPPTPTTYVPPRPAERRASPPPVWFTDVTRSAGIDFERFNGAVGGKFLPETMGGGAAFLDHDVDGDADLLLINGTSWPEDAGGPAPPQAFYRNQGDGTFIDVTEAAGFGFSMQGMGVAVGDVDGDGDPDVFLTGVGDNRLLVNEQGRFVDVTREAGVGGDGRTWSTAAAFLDVENDGDLDLYVGNYVAWSREIDLEVDYRLVGQGRAYGPPMNFQGTQPWLYRALGDGTYAEVGAEIGLHVTNPSTGLPVGKALGAVPVDLELDGWCDLVVANDTVANFLYRNQGGRFEEAATRAGFAFDSEGRATGAMGVDIGDYRNDGVLGIAVGNFANEPSSLFASENDGRFFSDEATIEGVGWASRLALSFGVLFLDYDLDGRLDLVQTNGHLEQEIHTVQGSQRYRQPAQLFWNSGASRGATFLAVDNARAGDFGQPLVGRGLTSADYDGDGDLDLLFTQAHGPPVLLRNDQKLDAGWIKVRLRGTRSNPDGIGAWLEVIAGDTVQRRPVTPTRGYLTQVESTMTFGLGPADEADAVRIHWPTGEVQEVTQVPAGTTILIDQER